MLCNSTGGWTNPSDGLRHGAGNLATPIQYIENKKSYQYFPAPSNEFKYDSMSLDAGAADSACSLGQVREFSVEVLRNNIHPKMLGAHGT